MSTVDDRVVGLRFNAGQFLGGVKATMTALDGLKKGMNLDGAKKSLDGLDEAGKKFSLANIANGVETMAGKFTALGVIGVTALATITSKAVNAGLAVAKSLTIDPVKQGFDEYNTNLGAIQTVLANTASAGTKLSDVNKALAQLNTYSDKTIYNFGEMAKNIGTFTAAGVDLQTSVDSIKGIANLAALSGSNSEQASTAMYQLSQAIAAGKVGLQDWNSVVNAGMGGAVFQKALAKTAENMGTLDKSAVKLTGKMKNVTIAGKSFRESLSDPATKGWLSSEVLTATLSQFTGDLTDAQLKAQGFSDMEIKEVKKQAKAAQEAATVVKTLPQLMDTLKESVGSGWSQSFQLIFGNFNQAKKLFTGVNRAISPLLNDSSAARNKILTDWQKLGGRNSAINAVSEAFHGIMQIIEPVKAAFRDIFPQDGGKALTAFSMGIEGLATRFQEFTAKYGPQIYRTFKGVFAVFDIGRMIIVGLIKTIAGLFGGFGSGAGSVLDLTANMGDFLVKVRDAIKNGTGLTKFFTVLGKILSIPVSLIGLLVDALGKLGNKLGGVKDVGGDISKRLSPLEGLGKKLAAVWSHVVDAFAKVKEFFGPIGAALSNLLSDLGKTLAEGISTGDFSGVLDIINTGLFAALIILFKKFLNGGLKLDIGGGFLGKLSGIFEGLTGTMEAMQTNLKAGALLKIAGAIGILTASVFVLSTIDSKKLTSALTAMTVMFTQLGVSMSVFEKIAAGPGIVKLPILAAGMILVATAIVILSAAVKKLSSLSFGDLIKGLGGVVVLLVALSKYGNAVGAAAPGMLRGSVGMIAIAVAVKILASAVQTFGGMGWGELVKGLVSVGLTLKALATFNEINKISKGSAVNAVGIILLGVALNIIAKAVSAFGELSVGTLAKGLISMAIALKIVSTAIAGIPPSSLLGAAALVVVSVALVILAKALARLGSMSWGSIAKSMVLLLGSLTLIAAGLTAMVASLPGAAALVIAAGALWILAPVLERLGQLEWSAIAKIVVGLAGVLLILAVGLTAMIIALPGAAALVVASAALAILQPVLQAFGNMKWSEILSGLGALALTLTVLGVAGVLLIPAIPGLIGLGVAVTLLGVAVLLAGTGVLAFATGLTALTAAGAIGSAAIIGFVTAILNLLPLAMTKLAEGIVAFAKVIGNAGPTFVKAMTTLILSLLTAINKVAPQIVITLVNLINLLLNKLGASLPEWARKGLQMLTKLLDSISSQLPGVIRAGSNLIVKFLQGLGEHAGEIADAGAKMVIKFVNGVADAIRNNTQAMNAAGANLAGALIDGMTGGLASKASSIATKAFDLGKQAISSIKNAIDSHSPSKETYKLGEYFDDGFANAIEDGGTHVNRKAHSVGTDAINTMKNAISKVALSLTDDLDTSPTIKPVLDLDAFKKDASSIGGMFGTPTVNADASYSAASNVSSDRAAAADAVKEKQDTVPTGPTEVKFEQNNYSPKTISATEQYRNTKNLISMAKEELKK